jgi:formylglycine-generating enzyme required for sulfatase activity
LVASMFGGHFAVATLAELPDLVGFFSYSREDDEAFKGTLSALRDGIHRELSAQLGRSKASFRLWQDQAAIGPGELWELEIKAAIDQAVFFIPIVTPRAVNSRCCKFEFEAFLAREKALGRNDLVFPILYISVPALENEAKWRGDPVLSIIARRQYVDWRGLRHLDAQTPAVREQIENLCRGMVEKLNEPWVSPDDRRREEEAKARQRADDEAQRLEAEAKRHAREEEARRRAETDAKQRAEEEEARRRAAAEARQRAEQERSRQQAEAKRWAEEKEAFAAAKRADRVSAVDAFLANYPESRQTNEARNLREALLARKEACKSAMASDDPAVLKAFLKTYPKGAPADDVRRRLQSLEPQTAFSRHRKIVLLLLLFCLLGSGLLFYVPEQARHEEQVRQPEPGKENASRDEKDTQEQGEKARQRDPGQSFRDTLVDGQPCPFCPEMVIVPSGSFIMGSPKGEALRGPVEEPQHRVSISKDFAVARYSVSFDEWNACVANGACNKPVQLKQPTTRPVTNVSWQQAKAYAAWLSGKTGKSYRLLTEAEREYVTRAGTTTPFWTGPTISTEQANYNGRLTYGTDGKVGVYRGQTVPVDFFKEPNPWGLYQVHGNVYEWVEDCWHPTYDGAPSTGSAWIEEKCDSHVLRGGSWVNAPRYLRAAHRAYTFSEDANTVGVRVARTLTP